MTSFTFSDNKTGGRLTTACDAIAAGKLRTAAGILNEVAEELNVEAESTDGLMSDAPASAPQPELEPPAPPTPQPTLNSMDLQSCARGAHSFPETPNENGWYECLTCGYVVVTPPSSGPYDLGAMR